MAKKMKPIPILTYHQIAPAPAGRAPFRGLYVSPQAFRRQMLVLEAMGYQGLSMRRLRPYLTGERQGKVVGITFDDGYLNNLTHAMPLLKKLGFSSTCYAVSALQGATNEWDAAIGIAQTPLMTATQLRTWADNGQDVGAHTRHHVHLPKCDIETATDEIAGSKTELEAALQSPVTDFCYPYGEFLSEQVAIVRQAGFTTATSTRRGRAMLGDDLLQLKRVPVNRSNTLPQFWWKLVSRYEDKKGAA